MEESGERLCRSLCCGSCGLKSEQKNGGLVRLDQLPSSRGGEYDVHVVYTRWGTGKDG